MKQNDHFVSIILPVYNARKYLSAAVQSMLSQTYPNIEVIAIDDNSKDDSYALLRTFRKKDKRIRIYRNKKRYGLAVCLNRAVKRAKGQFIAFMDPTHISAKSRIKKQVSYLLQHPKVVAVGLQCTIIDHKNKKLGKSDFPADHSDIYKTLPLGSSMLFETTLVNKQLLPKDLLKFTTNAYPFVYVHVFMQILQYGLLANLVDYLHSYRKTTIRTYAQLGGIERFFHTIRLVTQSLVQYDYKPSLRSFF